MMSCDERAELLMLYAAGALVAEEDRELEQHLETGCPRCAGALAEAQALLAQLPLALTPVAPPAQVRRRLMAQVSGESAPSGRALFRNWVRPAIAAAVAAVLALALSFALFDRGGQTALEDRVARQNSRIDELQSALDRASQLAARQETEIAQLQSSARETATLTAGQQETLSHQIERLEEIVALKDTEIANLGRSLDDKARLIALYRSPDVRVFPLQGTTAASRANGRVFWDRAGGRWFFYASGLPPAGIAKSYQLWFITADDRKISAGTFDVDEHGQVELLDVVVPGGTSVTTAAVTDEPLGGSLQPTGTIRLVGRVPDAT